MGQDLKCIEPLISVTSQSFSDFSHNHKPTINFDSSVWHGKIKDGKSTPKFLWILQNIFETIQNWEQLFETIITCCLRCSLETD